MKKEATDIPVATKKRKANVKKESEVKEEETEDLPVPKKRRANAKKEPKVKDEEVDDPPVSTKPKSAAKKGRKVKVEEHDAAEHDDNLARSDEEKADINVKVKEEEGEHDASGSTQAKKKKAKTPRQKRAAKDTEEDIAQASDYEAAKSGANGVLSPEGKGNHDIDRGASDAAGDTSPGVSTMKAGKTRKAAASKKTKREPSQRKAQNAMSKSAALEANQTSEQEVGAEEDVPVMAKAISGRASRASKVRSKNT